MLGIVNFRARFRRLLARADSRFANQFRVGIAARLSISFAAVAILAATANFIVEQGASIVRTAHVEPAAAPQRPRPPIATSVSRPLYRGEDGIEISDHLMRAVDGFERAVQVRASTDSMTSNSQYLTAAKELDRASAAYRAAATSLFGRPAPKLMANIDAYEKAGGYFLQLCDSRRLALSEYMDRFEALDTQVKSSLDGAWTIFGRVLARRSMMQLRTNLDEIRRHFESIDATDIYDTAAVDAIVVSESAFASTLKSNEKSFSRSEGTPWMRQMNDNFSQLMRLRALIVDLDAQRLASTRNFSDSGAKIADEIPAEESHPAISRSTSISQAHETSAIAPAAPRIAAPIIPIEALSAKASAAVITTTTRPNQDGRRTVVAWITVAVLLLLLAVSVLTVRSILIPVGRMLDATAHVASGELDVRVPRGGIRELDTLAIGFNRMAAQLAAARDMTREYQHQLEVKVDERTSQLQHLAEHDPLTLLPNRRQLFKLLNDATDRAAKAQRYVGVFFIDIDNFKNLNDSMGHAFGDHALISIAQRLNESARSFGFAARLGGDEFTVIYEDAPSVEAVRDAGWKLVNAFHEPIAVDERELSVSVSVGASVYPDHESRAEDLLSAADAALFRAKALGRSQLAIFTPELRTTAKRKFDAEQGLRRAIERDEFELVYQPEVNLDSLELGIAEALLRWRLPDGRLATPDEFLAVAEESGLIIEVGDWVLRTAIAAASRWHHGTWPEARVAINVSPRQLLDHRFVERVQALLCEYRLPPSCIELELTESVLQTGPATIESLRRLRSLDVAIALDDFGTGYSSLASLEQLPLTRIKLDRSLIEGIDTSPRSAAITCAIIGLCDSLGLAVTAEGIERPEQLAWLLRNRTMYLQGYLISRPVPSEEFLRVKANISQIMHDLLLRIPTTKDGAGSLVLPFTAQRKAPALGRA